MTLPFLTQARAPLTREVVATNEYGASSVVAIPAERALTVYVDKRELVTLMTLGAQPELLVLGFLRNQRLVQSVAEVESITVDWDVGAAAVKTRRGISNIEKRTSKRVVTTGCGQGSMFGDLMAEVGTLKLPAATLLQSQLYGIVNAIRLQESTYKSAGSVHGCALFQGEQMLVFVEDVGRHNAIDTIAGWMWMHEIAPTLVAARTALPPEGAVPCLGRPGAAAVPHCDNPVPCFISSWSNPRSHPTPATSSGWQPIPAAHCIWWSRSAFRWTTSTCAAPGWTTTSTPN